MRRFGLALLAVMLPLAAAAEERPASARRPSTMASPAAGSGAASHPRAAAGVGKGAPGRPDGSRGMAAPARNRPATAALPPTARAMPPAGRRPDQGAAAVPPGAGLAAGPAPDAIPSRSPPAPAVGGAIDPPRTAPAAIPLPLHLARGTPPACPPALGTIPAGLRLCRCPAPATRQGAVLGAGPYAGGSATCRAALHAGAIGPRGGEVLVRVLPLPGEAPGGTRHGVAALPGRLDGQAYALLPATPGLLDWARRLSATEGAVGPALPRLPGRPAPLLPQPMPQVAEPAGLVAPGGARERPTLAQRAPPVLPPALSRWPMQGSATGAGPPAPVAGHARVVGPVRLVVAGLVLDLAGVEPGPGAEPRVLGDFLARRGGAATCEAVGAGPRYRCVTPDGIDLAEAALYNGVARVGPDASDAYAYAERAAREGRRGVWKTEPRP